MRIQRKLHELLRCLLIVTSQIYNAFLLYLFIFERSTKHLTCKESMKSIKIHHQRALRSLTRQNTELGLYSTEEILFWCRSKIKRTRIRTHHIYTCFVLCCCVGKYGMVWLTLMRNDKWLYHILISHVRLLFSTEHVGEKKNTKKRENSALICNYTDEVTWGLYSSFFVPSWPTNLIWMQRVSFVTWSS